jgi:hypothetical protein
LIQVKDVCDMGAGKLVVRDVGSNCLIAPQ